MTKMTKIYRFDKSMKNMGLCLHMNAKQWGYYDEVMLPKNVIS